METKLVALPTKSYNKELSSIFNTMSECYQYLGKSERFRAIAYEKASKTIRNMSESIEKYAHDVSALDELMGIGKSIAGKITEYYDTGKIETFEVLKKLVPIDLFFLLNTEGIGPSTLRLLHDQMMIETKAQLINAVKKGFLQHIKV